MFCDEIVVGFCFHNSPYYTRRLFRGQRLFLLFISPPFLVIDPLDVFVVTFGARDVGVFVKPTMPTTQANKVVQFNRHVSVVFLAFEVVAIADETYTFLLTQLIRLPHTIDLHLEHQFLI